MCLSYKLNITCRPTRNMWFVNVFFSTFRRQNNVVKNWQLVGGPLAAGAPSHGTTGTMVNLALCAPPFLEWVTYTSSLLSVICAKFSTRHVHSQLAEWSPPMVSESYVVVENGTAHLSLIFLQKVQMLSLILDL